MKLPTYYVKVSTLNNGTYMRPPYDIVKTAPKILQDEN